MASEIKYGKASPTFSNFSTVQSGISENNNEGLLFACRITVCLQDYCLSAGLLFVCRITVCLQVNPSCLLNVIPNDAVVVQQLVNPCAYTCEDLS